MAEQLLALASMQTHDVTLAIPVPSTATLGVK